MLKHYKKIQSIRVPYKSKILAFTILISFMFSNLLIAKKTGNSFHVESKIIQNFTVTGTITSTADNLPIPGVNIFVKGNSAISAVSDFDGKFKISLSSSDAI